VNDAAAVRHGRSRPDACSVLWDNAQAPVLGTAPVAMFWLALEQNGPWGAQAATHSHLDPALGATLNGLCQGAGGRLILIRRPGAHPEVQEAGPHRVYLAGGLAARPWLLEADLEDPARLARLTASVLAAMGGGDPGVVQSALPELKHSPAPVLMVCTNSSRDVCCAVRGRPVAALSALYRPGQIWECSHTGGHRFAPTGVLLPFGQTFGRLSVESAISAVDAATRGRVPAELLGASFDRGRSNLTAPEQAAESVVRQRIQETSLSALSTTAERWPAEANPVDPGDPGDPENPVDTWRCRVSHLDGRHWDVVAMRGRGGDDLPDSCGKEPAATWRWSVVSDSGR
jgi:hypothetical protein